MEAESVYDLVGLYGSLERLMNKSENRMLKILLGMELDVILRLVAREGESELFNSHKEMMDSIHPEGKDQADAFLRAMGIDPDDPEQVANGLVVTYMQKVKAEEARKR